MFERILSRSIFLGGVTIIDILMAGLSNIEIRGFGTNTFGNSPSILQIGNHSQGLKLHSRVKNLLVSYISA